MLTMANRYYCSIESDKNEGVLMMIKATVYFFSETFQFNIFLANSKLGIVAG